MSELNAASFDLARELSNGRQSYLVSSTCGFALVQADPNGVFHRYRVYRPKAVQAAHDASLICFGEPSKEVPPYRAPWFVRVFVDIPVCSSVELTEEGRMVVSRND